MRRHRLPQLGVAQADGLAGFLLQAGERVVGPPVAHAGQAFGQLGLQRELEPATARQRALRRRHGQLQAAIDLYQRGLLHRQRHGGDDALAGLERIACTRDGVARLNLPHDGLGAGLRQLRWRGHVPGHFERLAGGNVHGLLVQRQQRGTRRHLHLHGRLRGVAQRDLGAELVVLAHQRRQAADELQVLRGAQRCLAGAELARAQVGHGHDLEGGERIVQRHRDLGLAVGVELQRGLPQQQCVEQLARGRAPAAAARRHGLAAVVAPANDLHLRRGGGHAPTAPLQHGVEQVPAGVGHQLQQGLVHGGQRHLGPGSRLAVGKLGGDGDLRLAAHGVAFLVGRHLHLDLVRLRAHADFRQAQAVGGLGQVHQRGGRHVLAPLEPERRPPLARRLVAPGEEAVPRHLAQAPAQRQHAHVDVGAPALFHLELHRRVLAVEFHHTQVDDALALHRHQRRGEAERHAHLQARGLPGLIAFLFGQQVDAVVVLAAKPQLALARNPDRRGGLRLVAFLVARGHHQLHLAGFVQLGLTQQQTTAVALAGTDGAQVLGFGFVVVAVKATDHALARRGGHTCNGLHRQRHARLRLAVERQRQRLETHTAAAGGPALGLHACHHGSGPQGVGATQGLHLAVRVGIGGLEQQFLRLALGWQVLHGHLASAVFVERHGQLVGDHTAVLAGRGFLVVALGGGRCIALAWRTETEGFVVGVLQLLATHQGRHAHRQVRRTAARHVVDLHVGGHGAHSHQRLLGRRRHAPFEHRQAELLDAEAAGLERLVLAAQLHLVHAQLGGGRNLELALRAAPARGRAAPLQGLGVLLAAAHVGDDQGVGVVRRQGEALAGLGAQQVLHRHRFARAQQRAVKDGVGDLVGPGLVAGRHVEAPRLDAALPVAPGEGHVLHALVQGARADEVGAAPFVLPLASARLGRQVLEARDALRIGRALGQLAALAVGHAHLCARHGLALVQRSHPGGRVLAAQLEMHAQVGNQRRGAHVHGALRAMARVQQRLAQQGRGDLYHRETHRQRNTHHLKGTRVVLGGPGQLQRLHMALPGEQRDHARLHPLAVPVEHRGQRALHVAPRLRTRHHVVVIAPHLAQPGDDFRVAAWLQRVRLQAAHLQRGFHLAQRHWQQCGRVVRRRSFGEALDDAERRRREFGQWRQVARGHGQRKAVGIGQRPARGVLEILRQQ